MRSFAHSLPVVGLAAIAVFVAVASLKSQDNASGSSQTWEYATVIGVPQLNSMYSGTSFGGWKGSVHICFASAQGCRYEPVEVTLPAGGPFTNLHNQGFAKAAAQLGAQGWELTNTLGVNQDGGTAQVQMYFRRALNRR